MVNSNLHNDNNLCLRYCSLPSSGLPLLGHKLWNHSQYLIVVSTVIHWESQCSDLAITSAIVDHKHYYFILSFLSNIEL